MIVASPSGQCWIWTGPTRGPKAHRRGYLKVGGKRHATHRFAYELVNGPVPEGLELDHLCRAPLCFNPSHLEPVTHAENVRRGDSCKASDTHCAHGHPFIPENSYIDRQGTRYCTECQRIGKRRRRAAARERRHRNAAEVPSPTASAE
jgi:hypothetical protein